MASDDQPLSFEIADLVTPTAGREKGELFYVLTQDEAFLYLVNGKNRSLEAPKRKKRKHTKKLLRSETRVAEKLRLGDKVLNSELRRDLAYLRQQMQANDLGG